MMPSQDGRRVETGIRAKLLARAALQRFAHTAAL